MPTRPYAYHVVVELNPFVGSPTLVAAVEAVALGRAWTWRRATKTERPGYVAPDPTATPPVVEVVPADTFYALETPWEPTAAEAAALDAAFAAWMPTGVSLPAYKARVCFAADVEGNRRIGLGVVFGGRTYSLSPNARDAGTSLARKLQILPYPFATIDNSEIVDLTAAEVVAFVAAADEKGQSILKDCRNVKRAILAAATVDAVDATAAAWLAGS